MKHLFYLFILISFTAKAQDNLTGKYCTQQGLLGHCIEFKENNRFHFLEWNSLGNLNGDGKYSIENDSLILKFDSTAQTGRNKYDTLGTSTNVDSVFLNITLLDSKTDAPLSGVNVFVTRNMNWRDSIITKGITNSEGNLALNLKGIVKNYFLTTKLPGYQDGTISLKINRSYSITEKLESLMNEQVKNKTFRYKIVSLNGSGMEIQRTPNFIETLEKKE